MTFSLKDESKLLFFLDPDVASTSMYYVASSLASRDGTHAHCSMNIKCSVYSRAATITPDGRYVRRLFKGGYYSKCGVYSRKYGIHKLYIYNYIIDERDRGKRREG